MKALFVGLGGVGQRHLRNLRALRPDVEIAAVRHRGRRFEIDNALKADLATDIAKKYDVTEFQSMEEGLAFGPDIAIVSNPSSKHVETCIHLMERGIPLFVEKPAAVDRLGLETLTSFAEDHVGLVMVGYQLRFHPCVKQLCAAVADRRVGTVQSVEVAVHSYMPSWHSYEKPNAFYAGIRELGGGVILTEIHEVDLLCWLFGIPKSVMAFGGGASSLLLDVEETVGAVMSHCHDGRVFPTTLMMSFMQRPPARRFVVNGEAGRILMDIARARIYIVDSDGRTHELFNDSAFDRNSIFIEELEHFLECVRTGAEPLTSMARVADGHRTALALRDSLDRGVAVQP